MKRIRSVKMKKLRFVATKKLSNRILYYETALYLQYTTVILVYSLRKLLSLSGKKSIKLKAY